MNKPSALLSGMLAIAVLSGNSVAIAVEGGDWLEAETIENWNTPGADVPTAPTQEGTNFEACQQAIRSPQVPEDAAVTAAGWQLYGPVQLYGETTVVTGMANADGMCRPMVHQAFVFVDGEFAGTLSPEPMNSRTDGNLFAIDLITDEFLRGAYQRYEPEDALCCPSSENYLFFNIEEEAGEPVVVADSTAS
jgi:hypothetical protein